MQPRYIHWFQVFWTSHRLHFVNCQNLPITSTIKTFRKSKITVEGNCCLDFIDSKPPNLSLKISVKVYSGVHIGFLDFIYYQLYIWSVLDDARNQVLVSLTLIDAV